jgi:hypothetical protein
MKNGRELTVIVGTRLSVHEAAEWNERARRSGIGPSVLLRRMIQRELADWKFLSDGVRERAAGDRVLELFAETMAMTLEGEDLERFLEMARRVAPDSEFVKRSVAEAVTVG